MRSKFSGYFRPSRSRPYQSSIYNDGNVASEDSDYYSSGGKRKDVNLRFIIIRHGERVDNTYGAGWTQRAYNSIGQYYPFDANMPPSLPYRRNWQDYDVDTPLTLNGLRQSWTVGNTLSRYNSPIIGCYSSPACRSIQTADQILAGLGRKDIPIRIELGLFECSSWYAQSPINFMSDQELINGGLNIDQFYRSQVKNLRSIENEYQYYDRSKETMKKIIKLHRKTSGTILIVAHAPSLEVLTRHLMNGEPRPEHLVDLSGKVNYCSMTIVDGNPSSNIWQFRYTLDDELTWQQLNNNITRSATLAYQPSAIPVDYRMATPRTSQLRYFV